MVNILWLFVLIVSFCSPLCFADRHIYRLCVVERFSSVKKANTYCVLLKQKGSRVECVIGNSRVDCLQKVSKGAADFTLLQAEDLVVAANLQLPDLLVTSNIRFSANASFEYEVAVVVKKSSNITGLADLEGKKLCHPGSGYDTDWTEVIGRYLETRTVPQICDPKLNIVENRIKSASDYFKAACQAGPWLPDAELDAKLKRKYPNLCEICDTPSLCATTDKHWGRTGALYCLTDGYGDIAWARLDDIINHFKSSNEQAAAGAVEDYNLLCADGSMLPVGGSKTCSWIARPWPSIVSARKLSEQIHDLVSTIENPYPRSWKWAILHLLEFFQQEIVSLGSFESPEDYLNTAPGFQSAYSRAICEPPHTISVCTKSNIEYTKCTWLKEAALAFGVEPELMCLKKNSSLDCMKLVQRNAADIMITDPNDQHIATKHFGLKPILFATSKKDDDLYKAGAVVWANSSFERLQDLKGKKACFTNYGGVGWNSFIVESKKQNILPSVCPHGKAVGEYFSEACVPGINQFMEGIPENLQKLCKNNSFAGEDGAFRCLASGQGDVAFLDVHTIQKNTDGANNEPWAADLKSKNFRSLCEGNNTKDCYLSWASLGEVMIASNISATREQEMYLTFLSLQNMFGKPFKPATPSFQLFGKFGDQKDVLFPDATQKLKGLKTLTRNVVLKRNYEEMIHPLPLCSSAVTVKFSSMMLTLMCFLRIVRPDRNIEV